MAIKLKTSRDSIDFTQKGAIIQGADGGYYIPSVDATGNLTWEPTKNGMAIPAETNIKGPKGDDGADAIHVGSSEPTGDELIWINPDGEASGSLDRVDDIHVGTEEPTGEELIWINPEGQPSSEFATEEYVDQAILNAQLGGSGGEINLSNYYTKAQVDEAIEQIELTPGPKGDKGDPGADGQPGKDGSDYVLTEADKQEIAAMVEVSGGDVDLSGYYTKTEIDQLLENLPAGEAAPSAEEVYY